MRINPSALHLKVMKTFLMILTMLILTSCGKTEDGGSGTNWDIDPEYQEAYSYFIQEGKTRGYSLDHLEVSIKKVEYLSKGEFVICLPGRKIQIFEAQVITYSRTYNADSFRTWVVLHALGHCLLNRPDYSSGLYIMNFQSYALDFDVNRGKYLHDLFFDTNTQAIPQDGVN